MKPTKQTVELQGGRQFYLHLKRPGANNPQSRFLWDTGASYTSMNETVAKRLRLLTDAGNPAQGLSFGQNTNIVIASGAQMSVRTIPNAPLEIVRTGEVVRGKVIIMPGNGSSLLGVSHIRNVKTLKVKFRDT
jgi:predicted aspartyl protease